MSEIRKFYVAGVQFHQLKSVINEMEEGQCLKMVLEPSNKYDLNAVRLEYGDKDTMVGYVPRRFSSEVTAMITVGHPIKCKIEKLSPSSKPWEQLFVTIEDDEA